MKTMRRTLQVNMNGEFIGTLEKLHDGSLHFNYDTAWLAAPNRRPISLSMPLTPMIYRGDRVYNFFDNLLPDNPAIRGRIQSMFQISSTHPFDLLAVIGKDCVGAIQLVQDSNSAFEKKIRGESLSDHEIAHLLKTQRMHPLGMRDSQEDFRISIAGAQEKTALLWHEERWKRPLETTPTTHIFKLPMGMIPHQHIDLTDSCENEWLCLKIAEAFGLPVAQAAIHTFEDAPVLVVERFDRKLSEDKQWLLRLPQEDMCQALGVSSNLKYESDGGPGIADIMKLLASAEQATAERTYFFRAQVLFWILAGIDGHAKNFSCFIGQEGRFHLTPLYDIISAYPLMAKKQLEPQKIKMAMALRGKNTHYHWQGIQYRHFISTAKHANFSVVEAERIVDEMLSRVHEVIEVVSQRLPKGFPSNVADPIFEGMKGMYRRLK